MTGIYYVEAADWLRAVGITVVETGPCKGWQTRARSSGGFASAPLGVQWHHTASKTNPENDVSWQTTGSDDAPIGNATIMRDGSIWMVAAGAANTAGKGGPITFSRGTVPQDSGNTRTWAFEVANNGVGEAWPQVQIDAYFKASNEMNRRFGNKPEDLMTHAGYCQPSCPGRKIDPATASAVQGPWKPRSLNSSGTWNQDDVRAEAKKRAGGSTPPPVNPTPPSGGKYTVVAGDSWWGISQKLGCTVDQLVAANPPNTSSSVIHPGQVLNVPGGSGGSTPTPPAGNANVEAGKKATTPPGSPELRKSIVHSNVPWLQQVLCSMNTLPADGGKPIYNPDWVGFDRIGSGPQTNALFGDATYSALAYWQSKNNGTNGKPLTADGVYGTATANAMLAVRGK
jgi:LysM repeat protein